MKYDIVLLFIMIGIGVFTKKLSWKGWYSLSMVIAVWMMYSWLRA